MPQEPELDLERLLAEEEAAIRDDGFSKRVEQQAGRMRGVRRATLYGFGMVGFGIAVGSIVEVAPQFAGVGKWISALNTTVATDLQRASEVGAMVQGGGVPMLAVLAIAGGLLCSVFAFAQNR